MLDQQSPEQSLWDLVLDQAAQVNAAHQAQLQQQKEQKRQQAEVANQALIDALRTQLEADIAHELSLFLNVSYKTQEFGLSNRKYTRAIAVFTLTNEHNSPIKGYIQAMLVAPNGQPAQQGYQVTMPRVEKDGSKDIFQDLSGGNVEHCYRADLNTLLLRLIGEWEAQMQPLRQQLEQQQRQWQAQQEQQRLEREEAERLKAQEVAEAAQQQVVSEQIKAQIDGLVEGLRSYPRAIWAGKTLTVYKFVVSIGTYIDEEGGVGADNIVLWSLQDTLGEKGYIVPPPGSDQNPCKPLLNATVIVHQVTLTSTDDCARNHLIENRPGLIIKGVEYAQRFPYGVAHYQWNPEGEHRHYWNTCDRIPVKWVRLLLGASDPITGATLNAPGEDTAW